MAIDVINRRFPRTRYGVKQAAQAIETLAAEFCNADFREMGEKVVASEIEAVRRRFGAEIAVRVWLETSQTPIPMAGLRIAFTTTASVTNKIATRPLTISTPAL